MFIEYKDSPLPHAVIKNYFNEQELAEVWQEINFLTYTYIFKIASSFKKKKKKSE